MPANANDRHEEAWTLPMNPRYGLLKAGGLMVGGEHGPEGIWTGIEMGTTFNRTLDVGFSIDWSHRARRDVETIFVTDQGFEPPIRAEVTTFESSTDLVPFGVSLRLKLPTDAGLRPFVSTMLGYEVLYKTFKGQVPFPEPGATLLDRAEWFGGFAWQVAAGIEYGMSNGVSLHGELGVHRGEPSQQARFESEEVDLRVRMHGAFVRAGIRVAL
jgi:hypothetical protein